MQPPLRGQGRRNDSQRDDHPGLTTIAAESRRDPLEQRKDRDET